MTYTPQEDETYSLAAAVIVEVGIFFVVVEVEVSRFSLAQVLE